MPSIYEINHGATQTLAVGVPSARPCGGGILVWSLVPVRRNGGLALAAFH